MLERLTDRARRAMAHAHSRAQQRQAVGIHGLDVFLGITRERGVAVLTLEQLGVDVPGLRRACRNVSRESDVQAKPLIDAAIVEARRLEHNYVGTEHLLLALIRLGEGPAAGVLADADVSLNDARAAVVHVLDKGEGEKRQLRELVNEALPLVAHREVAEALQRLIQLSHEMAKLVEEADFEAASEVRFRLEGEAEKLRHLCERLAGGGEGSA